MATIWYSMSAIMDYIIWILMILTRMLCIIHVQRLLIKNKFHMQGNCGSRKRQILQQKIGWPSYTTFIFIVYDDLISNSGITVDCIERVVYIYGTLTSVLKLKTTRVPPFK